MQGNHPMLKNFTDICNPLILKAKQKALQWLKNPPIGKGVLAIMGINFIHIGRLLVIGRLRVAKHIVKEAMDEKLFNGFIWISFKDESEWTAKNIQMKILESLQLNLEEISPTVRNNDDDEEERLWNETDMANRIFNLMFNKKLLLVLEDPPERDLIAMGIPPFYAWGSSKLLIVTASQKVCELMQSDAHLTIDVTSWRDIYEVVKEECLDMANMPMFSYLFTKDNIFNCFRSLSLLDRYYLKDDDFLRTIILYYWIGDGLLEGRCLDEHDHENSNTFSHKCSRGKEIFAEFERRGLLYYEVEGEQGNLSFFLFRNVESADELGRIHLPRNDPPLGEDLKWISLHPVDVKKVGAPKCPNASVLVFTYNATDLKQIQDNIFEFMVGLRVVDLSKTSISSLPSSLSHLSPTLKVLIFRNCKKICKFPYAIQLLNSLEILDMSGTSVDYKEDGQQDNHHLGKLQLLNLSKNNNLSSLPPFLSNLCNLEEFHLSNTPALTQLPETCFQYMEKLLRLDLSFASTLHSLPYSISYCINLKTLSLKNCSAMKTGGSHIQQLQSLETLDLSGCHSLQDISVFSPVLPKLQSLDLSKTTGILQLCLTGCQNLEEVNLQGCSGLEVVDLSGTKIKRFPVELFEKEISLKKFYMLGKLNLCEVSWKQTMQGPKEFFGIVESCDMMNSSSSQINKQPQPPPKDGVTEAFISLRNFTKFFKDYGHCPSFLESFQRFHVIVSPCPEREIKGKYLHMEREGFLYKDIFCKKLIPALPSTPSCIPSPYKHFTHVESWSRKGGHLEITGGDKFPTHLFNVFKCTDFFCAFNNKFAQSLSDVGLNYMERLRECLIEKCHGMEVVFDTIQPNPLVMPNLQIIWINNLSGLRTVFNKVYGEGHFGSLKHISVEYCPKLINLVTSYSEGFKSLETLTIRFCVRLEEVFADKGRTTSDAAKNQALLFPKLHTLYLWELSSLTSISGPHVYFPNLKKISVGGCPKLHKLPNHFDSVGCADQQPIEIKGEFGWWSNIKWEKGGDIRNRVNFIGRSPHSREKKH